MKKLLATTFALALAACTPAEPLALTADQESELSAAVEGRTAGRPVDCVSFRDLGSNRSIGEGIVLFTTNTRGIVYVNRPAAGCPDLRNRTLVVQTPSSRLCRGDIATVVDLPSQTNFGGCALGEFTPYTR